jgi:hypothetical protein
MLPAFIAVWFSALFAALTPAWAHQAPSGAAYEFIPCCSNHDCSPIPDRFVRENADGSITVTIPPGAHPMWPADKPGDFVWTFTGEKIRKPLDGDWHACISPLGDGLCVYPAVKGF